MEVTQVFRPVSMRNWFMIDPVLNHVKNNSSVDGVKAEVAEAVCTPDGHVIWRISGVAQKAETAVELEDGRQKNESVVSIGTLKVDPLKLLCVPKRIITRSIVDVAPMSLVHLEPLEENLERISHSKEKVIIGSTILDSSDSDSPQNPTAMKIKEEPEDDLCEDSEDSEEWNVDLVEETIAPVRIKQERFSL